MADLLIPLLLVFTVVGGVLVWALVRQLRELDEGSDRPFGGWREGGPDPELPWRRRKADRPAAGGAQRQAGSGRPTLPWQRREQQPQPARPRPAPTAPAPQATRPGPAPQPARSEPAPQPARSEPAPQPARSEPAPPPARSESAPPPARPQRTPQPARPALPWQRGGEQAERGRPRRPRQPAWLTLPGQRRSKDEPRERPQPASRPERGEGQASPDRRAPLWQRPRAEAAQEPPAPARPSGRCATCGGTGQAIVSRSGGGLGRGPCPVCQGS